MGVGAEAAVDQTRVKRILLIVDYCHTGDALRIAPHVDAVRERYPRSHITLVANEHTLPVFEQPPVYDRIVLSRLYDLPAMAGWDGRLSQAGEWLRLARRTGTGYDLVITFWWGTPPLHLLGLFASPLGRRIGYTRKLPWLLTSRMGMLPDDDPVAEHAALLRLAGIEVARAGPRMRYTEAEAAEAARLLEEHGLDGAQPVVAVHPGSDWACQQWRPERWAALADAIATRFGAAIVFTGVSSEAGYVEGIRRQMRAPAVSLVGRTTLGQLAALLARVRLCVCVDSAVYELTQAMGVPAVVLAGPTSPERVVPGIRLPVIVNPLDDQRRREINDCRVVHDGDGGCGNHQCPMAGLREISTVDALRAVVRQAGAAGLEERPQVEAV
jgi:ADP-heptose:LPS heptosyltransferase